MKIYRNKTELDVKEINVVLHAGGLGDGIASLPAIKFILDYHKYIGVNLFCHDYFVALCKSVFKDYENISVTGMSEYHTKANEGLPARSPHMHQISNLSSNMVDQAFLSIVGTIPEDKYKNYLKLDTVDVSEFNLPEKYAVVTTGFTSKTREWKADSVNETVVYLLSKGITPVFLGKSYTPAYKNIGITGNFQADYEKEGTINLIDKTDLFQASSIMSKAVAAIGCDNGLLHLAAMTEVPIIYAFTSVLKEHRLPYRHDQFGWNCYPIELPELSCYGCQSKMTFATHCFTTCFYGEDDYKCIELLTSDKFIKEIEKILNPVLTAQEKSDEAYQQILRTQELNRKIKELGI